MDNNKIKKNDAKSLNKEVSRLKKELFNLKLQAASSQLKDYSQFKKLRKEVAKVKTFLNMKKNNLGEQK